MFRNHKLNIGYVLAMVSICFAFWAYAIVVPTRAAYRTQNTVTSSARIAKFCVTCGTPQLISSDSVLDCNIANDSVAYELAICNESEVDVDYRITVSGFSENVSCAIDYAEGSLKANGETAVARITFSIIDPQDKSQPVNLDAIVATVVAEQRAEELP